MIDEEREWEEINKEFSDTNCPVFADWVSRRNGQFETWGVFVTGGIFDTITSIPFPNRDR